MPKGRKPKPTALKIHQGNPGKRPLNDQEPTPTLAIPDCPDHLDEVAAAEWARIAPELLALGLMTNVDSSALAAYCQSYSRWAEAEKQLKEAGLIVKSPSGYPIQNPYLGIISGAMKQMKAFLTEFGLTPSSRSRIKVEKKDDRPKIAIRKRA